MESGCGPSLSESGSDAAWRRRAMLAGIGGLAAGAMLVQRAGAGPLNPPAGPIAGTGKTLTEVEPRTIINAANTPGDSNSTFRILQPGSYYLTENVVGVAGRSAIKISSDNVTIDLNGFVLFGVGGSRHGITTEGSRRGIVIRNGHVRGWSLAGVRLTTEGVGAHSIVEGVLASFNGQGGIETTSRTLIRGCSAYANGGIGIYGDSMAVITDCVSNDNTAQGIVAGTGAVIARCSAASNDTGIQVGNSCTVRECVASANRLDGIRCAGSSLILGNTLTSNGPGTADGAGIHVGGVDSRVEGNNCIGNRTGVYVTTAGNLIIRNTCSGNLLNWGIVSGNCVLVVNATTAGAISGNSGGASLGSSDGWANFTF